MCRAFIRESKPETELWVKVIETKLNGRVGVGILVNLPRASRMQMNEWILFIEKHCTITRKRRERKPPPLSVTHLMCVPASLAGTLRSLTDR